MGEGKEAPLGPKVLVVVVAKKGVAWIRSKLAGWFESSNSNHVRVSPHSLLMLLLALFPSVGLVCSQHTRTWLLCSPSEQQQQQQRPREDRHEHGRENKAPGTHTQANATVPSKRLEGAKMDEPSQPTGNDRGSGGSWGASGQDVGSGSKNSAPDNSTATSWATSQPLALHPARDLPSRKSLAPKAAPKSRDRAKGSGIGKSQGEGGEWRARQRRAVAASFRSTHQLS